MDDRAQKLVEKARTEDTLKQEFALTLAQRVERHLDLRPHAIVPNSHFAAVSAECHYLYRDGHFYGTISLAQSVAEALVKFLCERSGWQPNKDFEKNLRQLKTRKVISDDLVSSFTEIWKNRDDYHHLNPQIAQDRQKTELLAKEKLTNLRKIENELFAYTVNEGILVAINPKYWDQHDGTVPVFLRID